MSRNLDLIDQIHNLRDVIGLLNLGAQSLTMEHERNAIERGTIVAAELVAAIEDAVENEGEPA